MPYQIPPRDAFTPAERRLFARLRTPALIQTHLNRLPYNTEKRGESFRGFRQVMKRRTAHCAEAALFAACVMEQHGERPHFLILASADGLDHVLFLFRHRGRWGTVARSRDPGLHGRKPVFKTIRALVESYVDPYVDYTGHIVGYATADLRKMGAFDWRFAKRSVWTVERFLARQPVTPIKTPKKRLDDLRERYGAYRERHGKKPLYYSSKSAWYPIPTDFR